MPLTQLAPPYPIFTDKSGSPLDNGYLYFGTANLNPETNPITVYYDRGFTQPAAQPIRTSNGYVMRNGSPALIYANSEFSVTVRDKKKALVIYSPVGYGFIPTITSMLLDNAAKNVTQLLANTTFTYSAGVPNTIQVASGDILRTLAEGFAYEVAASGATNQHVTTAGGVKLYVVPDENGYNVKAFGAVGDGSTDDAAAFQKAVDVAVADAISNKSPPAVTIPGGGDYYLNSQITLTRNLRLIGTGWPTVTINHTGTGFVFEGIPAIGVFPRNNIAVENIRFTTGSGITATAMIQLGLPDALVTDPSYLYAQSADFSGCFFDEFTAANAILSYRGLVCSFVRTHFLASNVSDACVRMLQSNTNDFPFFSYAFNFHSCEFTNIYQIGGVGGTAIKSDAGDVWVHGGTVQGCRGDAVHLGANATFPTVINAGFFGTYWEANTGHHVRCGKAGAIEFRANKFTSGFVGNSFYFVDGLNATFGGCTTPNNACSFLNGGNVRLESCAYMFGSKDANVALNTPDRLFSTTGTGTLDFAKQLRVPALGAFNSGGNYLVTLSHYDSAQGGADGVTVELFQLRLRAGGTVGFTATSVSRTQGGTNAVTFTWAYDAVGQCLTVTPVPVASGAANGFSGMVINHNNAILSPL